MYWTGFVTPRAVIRRALHKSVGTIAVSLVVASGLLAGTSVQARTPGQPGPAVTVALATLSAQAQATHRLILSGGPFPYSKDGTVFGNRERLLPTKARGHYREYTVKTPGSRDRGARRIICGGKAPTQPDNCFYTDDHYTSFRQIAP